MSWPNVGEFRVKLLSNRLDMAEVPLDWDDSESRLVLILPVSIVFPHPEKGHTLGKLGNIFFSIHSLW